MLLKIIFTIATITVLSFYSVAQQKALTFKEAADAGIPFHHLDSLYKSAVHSDIKLAVFKSPEEQIELQKAYGKLLQDLGTYLKANNFTWEKQTKGFNRIYLSANGRIDYFLYNFPEGQLTKYKEKEFARLLESFIKDYQLNIAADENFAQCSPVKYTDS